MSDSPIALSQDIILEKLKNVIDPELFVNIVDLGLIYEIEVDADNPTTEDQTESQTEEVAGEDETPAEGSCVKIDMTMTSPACPAGPQLIAGAKKEVGSLEGVGAVEVKIVLDPPWTPDRMTEDAKDQLGIF
jgi:metal-sulfur cluster biosynthetic enzyme